MPLDGDFMVKNLSLLKIKNGISMVNLCLKKKHILNKKNFLPGSSKYFGLDQNSYDGRLYLSAMAYICNIAISNRIYLASIINEYIKKNLK